jgi:ATP-dependent Clp protease protease subunit
MPKHDELHPTEIERNEAETSKLRQEERIARLRADQLDRDDEMVRASELENRIYTFDTKVSSSSVQSCISQLGFWRRQAPTKPIEIVFNSPGGEVFSGLALYDYIQDLRDAKTRVDTTALGMAASMGGVLLQAGEKRTMSRHAYMLIHEVSAGAIGNTSELEDELKFTKRLQDRLLTILAERSTLTKNQVARRWRRKDWWLDADECLRFGFCDEVH